VSVCLIRAWAVVWTLLRGSLSGVPLFLSHCPPSSPFTHSDTVCRLAASYLPNLSFLSRLQT
jgi:hypothetical protein